MRHILDEKDLRLSEVSLDSFIRGFQLGSALFYQMRDYEGFSDERSKCSEKWVPLFIQMSHDNL